MYVASFSTCYLVRQHNAYPCTFDVSERMALNLVGDEPGLYHNMAVLFQVIMQLKPGRPSFHPVRDVLPSYVRHDF